MATQTRPAASRGAAGRTLPPRVLSARVVGHGLPPGAALVDRRTKWGNPFKIGRDGDRDEVVRRYRAWVVTRPDLMAALVELRGRDLVCWCAPEACHADVLLELANP